MSVPMILDRQLRPVAALDTATNLCWELKHNELSTAELTLPHDDPLNALCTALAWAHLTDGLRDLGVYRISGVTAGDDMPGGSYTYSLEHVLALLLDDVVFAALELREVPFSAAVSQLLDMQTERRWVLGECDFDVPVSLSIAGATLLSGLQSLCGQLTEAYTWSCDTSRLPFVLHIRRADTDTGCGIHYGRNLTGLTRQMDASSIVTRLYLLGGAAEDGRQVDVTTLTEGGVPYIDADTIHTWGVRAAIYQNGDLLTPKELLSRGRAILETYKEPCYTYEATALDLYRMTGYSWDCYEPGKLVLVTDDEHGVRIASRILTVSKQDANADPGSISITIASQQRDALSDLATVTQILQSVQSGGISNAAANFVVKNELQGARTEISQNAERILLCATKEEHNALGIRVNEAESRISTQADSITLLSGRTTVIETNMTEALAQIRVNNDSIGLLVSRTDAIDGRVTSAETSISALGDSLTLCVKKDELNSSISLTGDGVTIEGGVITLTGVVKTDELAAQVISSKAIIGYVSRAELQDRLSDYVLDSNLQTQLSPLRSHSHVVTVSDDGTITIGEVSSSGGSFRIADTQTYKDGVSAARESGYNSGRLINKPSAAQVSGVLTSASEYTLTVSLTNVYGNQIITFAGMTLDARQAYDNGYDDGYAAGQAAGQT